MNSERAKTSEERSRWHVTRLLDVTRHHSGNSKLIKGKLFDAPRGNLFPAFSASGQDVWREDYESEGDAVIVSAVGARCGKAFLASGKWSAIANTHVVWPQPDKIDRKFLWYRINDERFWIRSGTAQPFVVVRKTFERPFALPPLDEQQHIVAEIEKQFTRLDAGVASLKRGQTALKRYRASVLKAACEGRLVPTEPELARKKNRSYETGEQLLQRILKERREKWNGKGKYKEPVSADIVDLPRLPEGWGWARLEQLGFIFGGLTKNPKRSKQKKQLPYLRVAHVYANELRLDDIEHIGVEDSELAKLLVRVGDLLIVEGNGSKAQIGRLAIWNGAIDPCVHQNHLIKVRPVESRMPKRILYWLQSPLGRQFVELVASSTSGLYTLSVNKVGDLPIALPPRAEQKRIIGEIERRMSVVEELETVTSTELQRATRLRQSILHQAFSGVI